LWAVNLWACGFVVRRGEGVKIAHWRGARLGGGERKRTWVCCCFSLLIISHSYFSLLFLSLLFLLLTQPQFN
jgi:hypothetical protein